MTVVAAVARHGRIVMAADIGNVYRDTAVYGARKVLRLPVHAGPFTDDERLLGRDALLAGNGAIVSVLRRELYLHSPPETDDGEALQLWADDVAAEATKVLAGLTPPLTADAPDGNRVIDGSMLLGYEGQLFYLFTHQAAHARDGVAALGSGSDVALGVMHEALRHRLDPETAVRDAVELACRFAPWCRLSGDGPRVEHLPAP